MARNFIYNIDISKFTSNVIQEMKILHIKKGGTLRETTEYQELLKYIYDDCIEQKKAIGKLRSGIKGIQFISMIGTIGRKKYQEINEGVRLTRKGAKNYHKNYQEVLKGVRITSNYMNSNNIMSVIEQRDVAREYSFAYSSFIGEFFDKMETYSKNKSCLINRECIHIMEEGRKKVLSLSKKYQTNGPS